MSAVLCCILILRRRRVAVQTQDVSALLLCGLSDRGPLCTLTVWLSIQDLNPLLSNRPWCWSFIAPWVSALWWRGEWWGPEVWKSRLQNPGQTLSLRWALVRHWPFKCSHSYSKFCTVEGEGLVLILVCTDPLWAPWDRSSLKRQSPLWIWSAVRSCIALWIPFIFSAFKSLTESKRFH